MVGAGKDASATISNIPANAVCSVNETVPLSKAPTGYTWDAPIYANNPVTIAIGGIASTTVTNLLAGHIPALTVTLKVDGGPSGGIKGTFGFTATCTNPTATYTGDVTVDLASFGSGTMNDIPIGSICSVTEDVRLPVAPVGYAWGPVPASSANCENWRVDDKRSRFHQSAASCCRTIG